MLTLRLYHIEDDNHARHLKNIKLLHSNPRLLKLIRDQTNKLFAQRCEETGDFDEAATLGFLSKVSDLKK